MIVELEGLDGCGKSTQASMVKSLLEDQGYRVKIIHYPLKDSRKVELLNAGSDRVKQFFLNRRLAQQRKYTVGMIRDAQIRYDIVILDRYRWSGLAYGMANGFDRKLLESWDKDSVVPDVVILLHHLLDIRVGDKYSEKVKKFFWMFSAQENWPIVTRMTQEEETADTIMKIILTKMGKMSCVFVDDKCGGIVEKKEEVVLKYG